MLKISAAAVGCVLFFSLFIRGVYGQPADSTRRNVKWLLAAKRFLIKQDLEAHLEIVNRECKLNKKQHAKLSVATKLIAVQLADEWMKSDGSKFIRSRLQVDDKLWDGNDYVIEDVDNLDLGSLKIIQIEEGRIYLGMKDPANDKNWKELVKKTLSNQQLKALNLWQAKKRNLNIEMKAVLATAILNAKIELTAVQTDRIKKLVSKQFNDFRQLPSRPSKQTDIAIYCLYKVWQKKGFHDFSKSQIQRWKVIARTYEQTVRAIESELKPLSR